jgi:hypothetical protein
MSEVDELRAGLCAAYGLPEGSEGFLTGDTVDEVEASAARFADLVAAHREHAPVQDEDLLVHALTNAPELKAARQQALVEALHGRPQQPRDESGRFAASGGFDGGARQPLAHQRSPEQDHGETILQLAHLSKLGRSQF